MSRWPAARRIWDILQYMIGLEGFG